MRRQKFIVERCIWKVPAEFFKAVLFCEQEEFKVRKMEKISRAAVSRLVLTTELRLTRKRWKISSRYCWNYSMGERA